MPRQALILDGFEIAIPGSEGLSAGVKAELEASGFQVAVRPIRNMRIAPCRACFDCWLKTPGSCTLRDDFHTIARAYLDSDLAVFWTPVVFGSYGSGMKRVLERLIGLLTPFLRFEAGETHHPPRYAHNPALFGLGWPISPDPAWAAVFERLVARNAANLRSPRYGAAVVMDQADWPGARTALRTFLRAAGSGL